MFVQDLPRLSVDIDVVLINHALRPNLQLELTARVPIRPTETASLGTLTDNLAGRAGATFSVPVVSAAETLAEKVLS